MASFNIVFLFVRDLVEHDAGLERRSQSAKKVILLTNSNIIIN